MAKSVIRPGFVAVLRKGSRFRLHTKKEGYEGVAVEVRPPERPDLSGPSGVISAAPLLTHLVEGIFSELTRPSARSMATAQALSSAAVEMSMALLERASGGQSDASSPEFWASQLKTAIHGALHTSQSIEAIASRSELSYRQISRHFKKITGLSPKAYQLQKKIAEGEHLLRATNFSATQIALELGFPSSQHFSRAFKQVTGKVPGSLRKR
ncbi:MAG: helix-turn-helix transcriptional regulator [Spirochaetia bacterium]|nr:helix-turn-helix transcriptional regulator [Spirochaetia bacterium]